jgi:hypothetical protein
MDQPNNRQHTQHGRAVRSHPSNYVGAASSPVLYVSQRGVEHLQRLPLHSLLLQGLPEGGLVGPQAPLQVIQGLCYAAFAKTLLRHLLFGQ